MMRLTIILSLLLLATACHNPASDTSKAVTSEPAAAVSPQTASGQRYVINPQNSKVEFVGSKVTGSHNGSFQKFSGYINYVNNDPTKSHVRIEIEMSSVNTEEPKLTNHLKTPEFFDVAKFPQAQFISTAIAAGGDKGATHTVTGNFTLHGVTKAVSFPATINVMPETASVDSSFHINRKDFGIVYAGAADDLVRDEVVIKLTIRATKQ